MNAHFPILSDSITKEGNESTDIEHGHSLADDTLFAQAIVTASAGWMAVRTVFLPRVLDKDIPWKAVSHRQRVLGCLDEFALLTETSGYMQALGAVARAMHLRLRSRWSQQVEPIPYFPAFQSLRV